MEKPTVKLVGEDGNAFVIMGRISAALHKAGYKKEYIEKYQEESMSGDYDNLLVVATKYVNIE
jgi:hypothetical protein